MLVVVAVAVAVVVVITEGPVQILHRAAAAFMAAAGVEGPRKFALILALSFIVLAGLGLVQQFVLSFLEAHVHSHQQMLVPHKEHPWNTNFIYK